MSLSPDAAATIAKLLLASEQNQNASYLYSDEINAFAALISAIAWPSVVALALVIFRSELRGLIKKIKRLDIAGTSLEAEEEIQRKVDNSAAEVLKSPNSSPTANISDDDVRRSIEVGALSQEVPPEMIRAQVEQISAEYEGVRANMPSGPERTKRMGAVMAKMRTLGRAVFPYRQELISSRSPGKRLFGIAALQMMPDYNLLGWLAATTKTEVPYVQFQALNALRVAVRHAGPGMKSRLKDAINIAKLGLSSTDSDTSRWSLACDIEAEIFNIPEIKD